MIFSGFNCLNFHDANSGGPQRILMNGPHQVGDGNNHLDQNRWDLWIFLQRFRLDISMNKFMDGIIEIYKPTSMKPMS